MGLSAGWGKRLNWPDDYFQLSAELSYQRYILKDWQYFPVTNGKCNDLSIGLTLARASYDNPIYPVVVLTSRCPYSSHHLTHCSME